MDLRVFSDMKKPALISVKWGVGTHSAGLGGDAAVCLRPPGPRVRGPHPGSFPAAGSEVVKCDSSDVILPF